MPSILLSGGIGEANISIDKSQIILPISGISENTQAVFTVVNSVNSDLL